MVKQWKDVITAELSWRVSRVELHEANMDEVTGTFLPLPGHGRTLRHLL